MCIRDSGYIDDSAPGDLIGHVRSAFASASAHTRVTIGLSLIHI